MGQVAVMMVIFSPGQPSTLHEPLIAVTHTKIAGILLEFPRNLPWLGKTFPFRTPVL